MSLLSNIDKILRGPMYSCILGFIKKYSTSHALVHWPDKLRALL